jgi:hypothetical protein
VLREEGIPYVVYSGHALDALEHLGGVALTKPSPTTTLIESLRLVLAGSPAPTNLGLANAIN